MLLYPNPNNGNFTIDIENIENATIEIYNLSGQLILKEIVFKNVTQIDLKEYQKGLYIVKIISDNKVAIKKIVYQ